MFFHHLKKREIFGKTCIEITIYITIYDDVSPYMMTYDAKQK